MRHSHLNSSPFINCDKELSWVYCGNNTQEGLLLL